MFYPKHLVHPAVSLSGDGSRRSLLMQSLPFLPRFIDRSSEPAEKNNTMSCTVSSSTTEWRPCSEARAARHHHEPDPGCLARGAAPARLCCTSSQYCSWTTRAAPLGQWEGPARAWWGGRSILLFTTWMETIPIPCRQPRLWLVGEHALSRNLQDHQPLPGATQSQAPFGRG